MAVRRRSKGLQQAVDNFTKGLGMGWAHQDRQLDREAKLEAAKFAREKWKQEADLKRQELGISGAKAQAYIGLAGAQAGYYGRKGAGGGGGAGSAPVDQGTVDWMTRHGGGTVPLVQPPAPTAGRPESPEPPPLPDPGMAQGGKVPQKFARGGLGARMGAAFGAGARMGTSWADKQDKATTPPINPAPPATPALVNSPPAGDITRRSTVQTYYDGGKSGPGSGFGEIAAPPPEAIRTAPAFQQGGRVQKFQAGGVAPIQKPRIGQQTLLSTMADAVGATPIVGPIVRQFVNPQNYMDYGPGAAGTPNQQGPAPHPGQPVYTSDDREAAHAWAEGRSPARTIPRQQRDVTPTAVPSEQMEQFQQPRGEPPPSTENRNWAGAGDQGDYVSPTATNGGPRRGGGGGGGYRAVGGGLGDQRRTTAYDPVADRMDPRNIGVVYAPGEAPAGVQGTVNPMVYAATQHGGIELNAPGQQIYRQGGKVQRFQRGGGVTQGARLPVPVTGREYGGVPQGAGEPPDAGQAEADALTQQWREEALAAAEANQQAAQAPPGGNRYGGQTYGGNTYGGQTYGGNRYGGNRFGASAPPGEPAPPAPPMQTHGAPSQPPSPNLTGPSQDAPPGPPMQVHGAPSQPPSPRLTGPSQDDPPQPPMQIHGAPSQPPSPRLNAPRTDVPGRLSPTGLPPAPSEETGPDAPLPSQAYVPQIPDPTRPTAHDEAAGTGQRITAPPTNGGARPPTQPSSPSSGRAAPAVPGQTSSAGQDEADRLTREWNEKNQAKPGVGPITKKGAVDVTPPMQQGVGEPEGGQGLRGPGPGLSTNNAARDHLGAATTFADWALKDAGPQKKDEAQAALYSGKGAGTTEQIAAMMMAVDPENKMPLDKRFEAATKLAHDIHVASGDVKAASQSAFEMMQYGVTKAREHGGQAVKMLQQGNEQGALKELMAGYTWIADNATVATKDGSIVVTGDDGKVRAQIPLQPGTVQNLAMGMMSGQLPWDAIRRGSQVAGGGGAPPAPPSQAVSTSYPATGNPPPATAPPASGPAAQPSAAPAAPAPAPAAPAPSPPAAVDTRPPAAQPKPAPAPKSAAPAPAPRPTPAPTTQPTAAGGAQAKPTAKPSEPGTKSGETRTVDGQRYVWSGGEWVQSFTSPKTEAATPSKVEPGKTEQKSEQHPAGKTDAASAKDDEAKLKEWHDKHPYEPPPGEVRRKTSVETSGVTEVNDALKQNRAEYERGIAEIDADAAKSGISKKDFQRFRPQLIAKLKEKHDHTRDQLIKQRDRVVDRAMAAEQREREKEPRKIDHANEEKFKETFTTRAAEIMKVEGRTPEQKKQSKEALDRSVLRYQVDPSERKELERLAREVWKTNEPMDTRDAFDAVIGMTEIHPTDTGKTMNRQKGEKATSFQPVARTPRGDYVVLLPSGEEATISENVYHRLTRLHRENWAQWQREQQMSDAEKAKQAKARETLAKEAITTRAPTAQGNK